MRWFNPASYKRDKPHANSNRKYGGEKLIGKMQLEEFFDNSASKLV